MDHINHQPLPTSSSHNDAPAINTTDVFNTEEEENMLKFFLNRNTSSGGFTSQENEFKTTTSNSPLQPVPGLANGNVEKSRAHPFAQPFPPGYNFFLPSTTANANSKILESNESSSSLVPSPNSDPLTLLYQQQGISPNTQIYEDGHVFQNISPNTIANTVDKPTNSASHNVSNLSQDSSSDIPSHCDTHSDTEAAPTPSVQYYSSSSSRRENTKPRKQQASMSNNYNQQLYNNMTTSARDQQHLKWLQQVNSIALDNSNHAIMNHVNNESKHQNSIADRMNSKPFYMDPIQEVPISDADTFSNQTISQGSQGLPSTNTQATMQTLPKSLIGLTSNKVHRSKNAYLAASVQAQAEENLRRLSFVMNLPSLATQKNTSSIDITSNVSVDKASNGQGSSMYSMNLPHQILQGQPPQFGYTTNTNNSNVLYMTPATTDATIVNGSRTGRINNLKLNTEENSNDKRARRLARNRESARQSRRRKRDQLQMMGKQVENMWDTLEHKRQEKLNGLESGMRDVKLNCLSSLHSKMAGANTIEENDYDLREEIRFLVENLISPSCPTRVAAIEFQYKVFLKHMLPLHRRYFLWLSLQSSSFFTKGKEGLQTKKPSGRLSSKQVGEEITSIRSAANGKTRESTSVAVHNRNLLEIWSLFCYEMSIGLDQEDRFIATHDNSKKKYNLDRQRLESAIGLVNNVKKISKASVEQVGKRQRRALTQILTPVQAVKFLSWSMTSNKISLFRALLMKKNKESSSLLQSSSMNSLDELCSGMNEVLNINVES